MIKKALFILICLFSNACLAYCQESIVISKKKHMLYVVGQKSDTLFSAPIAVGRNYGNKTRPGDMKTPEGVFSISQIQNSGGWTHDFHDGHGERKGAYGPWFFRVKVPRFTHIGIHGTCFPKSIGTHCSEGCVRLHNEDLEKLRQYVQVGMKCTILPDGTKRRR